jgi:hypothetical protein
MSSVKRYVPYGAWFCDLGSLDATKDFKVGDRNPTFVLASDHDREVAALRAKLSECVTRESGWTDDDLREWWLAQGGKFHGPNVETGTMPEAKLLPTLRRLLDYAHGVSEINSDWSYERDARKAAEAELATLRQQAEAMRAAVECADAYDLRDDWRDVLARYGWNEDDCVAAVFVRKMRRIAIASTTSVPEKDSP